MEIIIILIVAGAILFFVGKYVLFNVYVNSVLFMIAEIFILSHAIDNFENVDSYIALLLFGLCLCDCIRDLAVGNKFYKEMSDGIDKRFAIKSLISTATAVLAFLVISETLFIPEVSILLIFVPRIAFLLVVNPITKTNVNKDVKDKFLVGYPLPFQKWMYSSDAAKQYYYNKITKKLFDDGKLVTNAEIVFEERDINHKKVDNRCPKKLFDRIKNMLFTSSEEKEQAQQTENRIKRMHRHTAYINSAFYESYESKIIKVVQNQTAPISPWKIKEIIDQELHLSANNQYFESIEWSEYFIIKCLKKLVLDGSINDFGHCSDEPFENHAFGTKMPSRDANSDPRLALDDD